MSEEKKPSERVAKETRPLRIREKKFVKALIQTNEPAKAVVEAGYSDRFPSNTAHKLLARPIVQREIDRVLSEVFPDHDALFVSRLKEALSLPFSKERGDGGMSLKEFTDLAKVYAQIKGHNAPTQSQKIVAKTNVKLPGSE